MTGALQVDDVTVRFGGLVALDSVSFDVRRGSILGIIGPNGAGKSTMFDAICGLVPLASGRVILQGADVTTLTPHARAHRALGRSFQDGRLFPSLTVTECIGIALERHERTGPFTSAIGGLRARRARRKVMKRTDEVVTLMGLQAYVDAYLRELSTGTRRLVDLACAVAHHPSVLLLDEPSSGIAQKETEQLVPLIRRVQAEIDCTIVLIEHDIALIRELADELIALEAGKLISRGDPQVVLTDEKVVAAYLGKQKAAAAAGA